MDEQYKMLMVNTFLEILEELGTECLLSITNMIDSNQDIPENPCSIIQEELNRLTEMYNARIIQEKEEEVVDDSNVVYIGKSDVDDVEV